MVNVLILAAGGGKRFKECGYELPKPLINVMGKPMIQRVVENLGFKDARHIFMVQKSHCEEYGIDDFLLEIKPNSVVVPVDGITDGAARTCLLATEYINDDFPLVIANCDQLLLDFDAIEFINTLVDDEIDIDGIVPVFKADAQKWSYAKVSEDGFITEVAEKKVISNNATVGIYGFRHGSNFVWAANEMIRKDVRVNGEFYVCPVIQQLIDCFHQEFITMEYKQMFGLGTPSDLEYFWENHLNV